MENKKTVIALIIFIIMTLSLAGYIVVDKFVLSKELKPKTTQVGDVEVNLNVFEQINETLNTFDAAFNDTNSKYVGYLFSQKEITSDNFDQNAALYASIYRSIIGNGTQQTLPGGIVKTNYEKLFDNKMQYKAKSIDAGNIYKINYDIVSDNYTYIATVPQNIYTPTLMEKNIETTVEDDNIVIKRKVFLVEYVAEGAAYTKANIYKSQTDKTLVATMPLKNNTLNVKELIGKYGTKLKTYKYTFKQKSIDEYKFYSVEESK